MLIVLLSNIVPLPGSGGVPYVDPGTGGVLLQILLGGATGILVLVGFTWRRITSFLPGRDRDKDDIGKAKPGQ